MSVGENASTELKKEEKHLAALLVPGALGLSPKLPIWEIRHELCDDSSSEPAVRIWVVIDDSKNEPLLRVMNTVVEDTIWQALANADIKRLPLIYFRLRSEQAALDAAQTVGPIQS